MFIDGIVIGILLALFKGGKLKNLLAVEIKHSWLILVSFTIQFTSIIFLPSYLYLAVIISTVGLIVFVYLNKEQFGFKFMTLGMILNFIPMLANNGRMPVDPDAAKILSPEDYPSLIAGEYGKHIAISSETHFNLLGDIFFLKSPYPRPIIISLGDLILTIGVILFLYKIMVNNYSSSTGGVENAS